MPRHAALSALAFFALASCSTAPARSLAGDWDAYSALGSTPLPGFEGWRRMGFAHFGSDSGRVTGAIRSRTGDPILDLARVEMRGDSVLISGARKLTLAAAWHDDTLSGVML